MPRPLLTKYNRKLYNEDVNGGQIPQKWVKQGVRDPKHIQKYNYQL